MALPYGAFAGGRFKRRGPERIRQAFVRSFPQGHAGGRRRLAGVRIPGGAATAGLVEVGLPVRVLSWSCYALALGLVARAVGEFKYVGFFKRVRGSRFARLDTLLYSPLCLLLAVGVTLVAGRHGI
jgi:hypothetical protein